ncbi:putative mediator of RNA polymerase II transcription subunit 33A/B [Helianthus anomalus]
MELFGLFRGLGFLSNLVFFGYQNNLQIWMFNRLVCFQERDPIEGPMPRLDTRLCMFNRWPGYVTGHINQIPHGVPAQVEPAKPFS